MPQIDTKEVEGVLSAHPVKSGVTVYAGQIGCLDSTGFLVSGSAAEGLVAIGRIEETVTGDGVALAEVKKGTFLYKNAASDKLTRADIGKDCYISGPSEVCKTGTGKSLAGKVYQIDGDYVAVTFA